MEILFGSAGQVTFLDKSVSPWTDKFACPGHMCVSRKPWLIGNKYHTICCCLSGIMYLVEIVEGKECPPQKPNENFLTSQKMDQLQHYY